MALLVPLSPQTVLVKQPLLTFLIRQTRPVSSDVASFVRLCRRIPRLVRWTAERGFLVGIAGELSAMSAGRNEAGRVRVLADAAKGEKAEGEGA